MRQDNHETAELSPEGERVVRAFERAWQGPDRPRIESHLPTVREATTQLLVELIHIDLDLRLRSGEAARVEDYLERFPPLAEDPAGLLSLIAAEFSLRRHWQVGASEEEYLRRFP